MDDRELVARLKERAELCAAMGRDDVPVPRADFDAVLAALSAAGRLRAEVAGDVVEAATQRVIATRYADIAKMPEGSAGRAAVESVRRDIAAAAPIIAADAERRVRAAVLEEAEQAIRCCGALDENGYFCEKAKAIAAIRALLTPSPAAQPEGESFRPVELPMPKYQFQTPEHGSGVLINRFNGQPCDHAYGERGPNGAVSVCALCGTDLAALAAKEEQR